MPEKCIGQGPHIALHHAARRNVSEKLCFVQIPDAGGLIPANIENGISIGTDALIMFGILIGMRIVAYVQMTIAISRHKL